MEGDPALTWHPIETAPKDGTLFLAWCPGVEGLSDMFSLCAWHADAGFCVDELRHPTYWMPLPKPPRPEKPPRAQSRLQEIRLARGLTGAELARLAGMNAPTVYRIDTGLRGVSANFRDRLARALGVTPGELYEPIGAPIPGGGDG